MSFCRLIAALGLGGLLLATSPAAPPRETPKCPRAVANVPVVPVAARRAAPEKVRVATYNIEFLGGKPNGPNRIDRLKAVIAKLDADVIGLQEIKDRAALRQIFPANQWQILIDDDSSDGQDPAIAVRLPFKIVGSNGNDLDATDADFLFPADTAVNEAPFPGNRDVLFARIAIPDTDRTFVLMVHHAKARVGGRHTTDPRRKLAAELIVSAIQTRFDGQDVILLGDMNDNPDDESINILETGDASAAAGPDDVSDDTFLVNLTQPLLAMDHVSWGLDQTKIVGAKLETRVPGSRNKNNATRHQSGSSSPILFDQILLSRESLDRYAVAKVMVFDDPVAQEGNPPGANGNQPIDYASDHTPVFADLALTPQNVPPATQPALPKVRIAELLPNPEGEDAGNEEVTLKNFGTEDVHLVGWRLIDKAGNELRLNGVVKAGGVPRVIRLPAGKVPLNNGGDEVRLFDENELQDRVRYSGAEAGSGVRIRFTN